MYLINTYRSYCSSWFSAFDLVTINEPCVCLLLQSCCIKALHQSPTWRVGWATLWTLSAHCSAPSWRRGGAARKEPRPCSTSQVQIQRLQAKSPTLVKVLELPKLKILVSAENRPETVILCDVIRLILMYQSVSSVNI